MSDLTEKLVRTYKSQIALEVIEGLVVEAKVLEAANKALFQAGISADDEMFEKIFAMLDGGRRKLERALEAKPVAESGLAFKIPF